MKIPHFVLILAVIVAGFDFGELTRVVYAECPLKINEFMASNSGNALNSPAGNAKDEHGDYDDWIEIFNSGAETVDAAGMYLMDDDGNRWRFPGNNPLTAIASGGYLLIWADNWNDNDANNGPLHASFKLSAGGDKILLYDTDGESLIDGVDFGNQTHDISYGRDANDSCRFFPYPSPGWENDDAYLGAVADTKFSHDRGFYDLPFSVTIDTETQGATIRYTTNGSAPSETVGQEYTGAVPIDKTTCLRAMAFKTGFKPTDVDTQTYMFVDEVIEQPVMSTAITQNPVWGPQMRGALLEIPTISLVTPYTIPDSPIQSPPEVPVSIEMIFPDGTKGFQANAGVERFGGQYTLWPKQSLRISFKSIYGPSRLTFDLFGDTPYGGDDATDSFNQIILRSGSHDSLFYGGYTSKGTYVRNRYCFDRQLEMGHLSLRGRFVHVYLNGVYWGQYHLMERPTADFMATYLGGDEEDYDIMKGRSGIFVADGDGAAWNYMVANTNNYHIVQEYMDIDNYIDYMLLNFYGGNDHDWYPHHNWVAGRGREAGNKFMFFMWDNDFLMRRGVSSNTIDNGGPGNMLKSLMQHKDFKVRLADRAQKHFFNDGMFTPARVQADFTELADRIARTIIPECARWRQEGFQESGVIYTPDSLRKYVDWIKFDWGNVRTGIVLQQMRAAGLFPDVSAPVLYVNGVSWLGGYVSWSDLFSIAAESGVIYYTINGDDPRLPGGAVNTSAATAYAQTFSIGMSRHIKARAKVGETWSPIYEATFAVGPVKESLRITEIMYHPPDTNNPDEEFIELKNIGAETINLNLVRFTNGIDFTFPSLNMAAGGYVLVVKDQAAFCARYPDFAGVIAGQYSGSLANEGERIRLGDAASQTILDFKYSDAWRESTDGDGLSLTIVNPPNPDVNSWGEKNSWRASAFYGGSPGWDDTGIIPEPGSVVINEVLAHSHAGEPDWIELHNTTGEAMNIGGWFLSDGGNGPSAALGTGLTKYEIADGTVIGADGYLVFYEDQHFGNPADPGCHAPFALSENGERVYLSSSEAGVLTGYQEVEDFGASETGVAFGRYYKASTDNYNFVAMSQNTPGAANAYPKVGPIVINEVMYNPGSGNQDEEYIELYNITTKAITLYDYMTNEPWKCTDAIEYACPSSPTVTIPAGGYLLVVKDPDTFTARYGVMPAGVVVVGPYDGQLKNGGEKLELSMPGDVDAFGTRYYIRVDRVNFSDGSHPEDQPGGVDLWPVEADGGGPSLSRRAGSVYGNDVANWKAATLSPGRKNP